MLRMGVVSERRTRRAEERREAGDVAEQPGNLYGCSACEDEACLLT
jgi:hypothetical protein